VPRATREWSSETHPHLPLPRSPPPEYFTPTRDIHARARRWNVHVKRQKSRVERLPIRPLRLSALKHRLPPNVEFHPRAGDRAARAAASTIRRPLGRVAQWESARFTRERSQVRNPPRPLVDSTPVGILIRSRRQPGTPAPEAGPLKPATRAPRAHPPGRLRVRRRTADARAPSCVSGGQASACMPCSMWSRSLRPRSCF
jgi:hypothetical protein